MTSRSNVLTIGTETSVTTDEETISNNRKAFFESDFEKRMQKILLNGVKPMEKKPNDTLMERFSANELKKKDGQYYYDFGVGDARWFISVLTFDPKGMLSRVHNKISKENWVADNVAKFSKDSRSFIQQTVSNAAKEEDTEIYQYLSYLNFTK